MRDRYAVPHLLLLNGFPASGKSTLARRWVADHPLALALDVDCVRGQLGRWQDQPHAAGLAARDLATAMARAHLLAGHDVVVPQFLGRRAFVDRLQETAHEAGAVFHHVVLLDDREDAVRRFHARTGRAEEAAHAEAGRMVADAGGGPALHRMYDRLLEVVRDCRPVTPLEPLDGDVEGTYARLCAALA